MTKVLYDHPQIFRIAMTKEQSKSCISIDKEGWNHLSSHSGKADAGNPPTQAPPIHKATMNLCRNGGHRCGVQGVCGLNEFKCAVLTDPFENVGLNHPIIR